MKKSQKAQGHFSLVFLMLGGVAVVVLGALVFMGFDRGYFSASIIGTDVSTSGNLIVGDGTPDVTQNGEDAYVEGTLEVDGNVRFDGDVSLGTASELLLGANSGGSATAGAVWFDGTNFLGRNTGGNAVQLDNAAGGGSSEFWYDATSDPVYELDPVSGVYVLNGSTAENFTFSTEDDGEGNCDTGADLFPGHELGSQKTIQAVKLIPMARAGTYAGDVEATLEIRNTAGVTQHTVSTAALDLEAIPVNDWASFSLSATAEDKIVEVGERVAVVLGCSDVAGGDFSTVFGVEVEVQ